MGEPADVVYYFSGQPGEGEWRSIRRNYPAEGFYAPLKKAEDEGRISGGERLS